MGATTRRRAPRAAYMPSPPDSSSTSQPAKPPPAHPLPGHRCGAHTEVGGTVHSVVLSPREHRAKRTRRGPIGATAADRDLGRDHIHNIHILFDIMTRPFGATAVRRCGSAAAGAVPGRHLRAPSGPEASGGAVWRRARASDAVWRHFVVTGRFLAVLMPTGGAQQDLILA